MNKLTAVLPHPLLGWLNRQTSLLRLHKMAARNGEEQWVIIPPIEIRNTNKFSEILYYNMYENCQMIDEIFLPHDMVTARLRHPNRAETVDYEEDDFRELEFEG